MALRGCIGHFAGSCPDDLHRVQMRAGPIVSTCPPSCFRMYVYFQSVFRIQNFKHSESVHLFSTCMCIFRRKKHFETKPTQNASFGKLDAEMLHLGNSHLFHSLICGPFCSGSSTTATLLSKCIKESAQAWDGATSANRFRSQHYADGTGHTTRRRWRGLQTQVLGLYRTKYGTGRIPVPVEP